MKKFERHCANGFSTGGASLQGNYTDGQSAHFQFLFCNHLVTPTLGTPGLTHRLKMYILAFLSKNGLKDE